MPKRPIRLSKIQEKITLEDFTEIKYLGKGAHGVVNLVRCNINSELYALKQLDKTLIARFNKVKHLLREKEIMYKCHHKNIVRLENTFQDDESWYFVLEYHALGDLTTMIKHAGRFNRSLTRFYAKELINALEFIRSKNVVHRDLKPENILIDSNFHWKISDFGTAKIIDPDAVEKELSKVSFNFEETVTEIDNEQSFNDFDNFEESRATNDESLRQWNTFVGTPLYVSPEMLAHNISWFASDLWGLGCIIYQWLCGGPPFIAESEIAVFDKILDGHINYPDFIDEDAKDLISKLLQRDPRDRLGAGKPDSKNSMDELKNHQFFKNQSFKKIYKKKPPVGKKLLEKLQKIYQDVDSEDDTNIQEEEESARISER